MAKRKPTKKKATPVKTRRTTKKKPVAKKKPAPAKPTPKPKAEPKPKRPPQRPGRKTKSDAELKARYESVAEALRDGLTKGQIKRRFAGWDVGHQQIEIYIRRAREILNEWLDYAKGSDARIEAVAMVAAVFQRNMNDPKVPAHSQNDAAGRFAKLFGLDAPFKVAPTTPDGEDSYSLALNEMNEEELLLYLKMCEKARKASGVEDDQD